MSCFIKTLIPRLFRGRRGKRTHLISHIKNQNWIVVKELLENSCNAKSHTTQLSDADDVSFIVTSTKYATEQTANDALYRQVDDAYTKIDGSASAVNNETIMHCLCRNQPPLEIVRLVNEKYPRFISTATTDEKHYPVHLACMFGAHPEVIAYLVSQYPYASSASSLDSQGRTSLHLIFFGYAEHYQHVDMLVRCDADGDGLHRSMKRQPTRKGDTAQVRSKRPLGVKDAMLKSVRILTKNFPNIVEVNDLDGMTALEHAICGNIHIDIVKSLQRAGERFLRAEKKKQLAESRQQQVLHVLNEVQGQSHKQIVQLNDRRKLPSLMASETNQDGEETTNNTNGEAMTYATTDTELSGKMGNTGEISLSQDNVQEARIFEQLNQDAIRIKQQ